jgi:RNase H.
MEQTAFERVKALFAESIQLQKPDYEKPFIIYTDGSYQGIGGILVQEDENDGSRVIATTSRSLSKQELRPFPTEVEICAVYHAIQKFRNYVFNRKIIVRSDSISLSFMHQCKLTSSRISRYIHEIMSHDITVEYILGTTNVFADLLSRIPRNKSSMSVDARERKEVAVMKLNN